MNRIILEEFSNIKNRPCIELGENSDVTLIVEGSNILHNTGIMVPESASFVLEGSGSLKLELTNQDFYGIGNDTQSRHGPISINKSGNLTITANGTRGTFIGSGLGGIIKIKGGSFNIEGNSSESVIIGSLKEKSDISITQCGIEMDMSGTRIVVVGSMEDNSKVSISDCSFKAVVDGREVSGLGTLEGDTSMLINVPHSEVLLAQLS